MGIAITAARLVRLLSQAGFRIIRQTGSHAHLERIGGIGKLVTIPMHAKDLSIVTLRSILRQAEIPMSDFLRMLGR